MKTISMRLLVILLASAVMLSGCGKKESATPGAGGGGGGIDLTKPISELKAAAAEMDLAALEKTAKQYMDQIAAKQGELEKLMDKFAAIPIAEKMGEEAKGIQTEITDLTSSIGKLRERFQVYVDYIKEKGGDISQYMLPK